MNYRNTNLTQRTGYPSRSQRHTHLDLPMADEFATDASENESGKKRSLQKESRVVRAVKNASFFTKATYVWLVFSLILCWGGWRSIRTNHGSVWLTCTVTGCDLEISPPGRKKRTKVSFDRNQIIRSDVVKVDETGAIQSTQYVSSTRDTYGYDRNKKGRNYGKKYNSFDAHGPDENGLYDSYTIVLKEAVSGGLGRGQGDGGASATDPNAQQQQRKGQAAGGGTSKLAPLFAVVEPNDKDEYIVDMRMFNRGETRRMALSMVTRVNSYIKNRRHKLTVRENRNVAWQAVVCLVVGIFSLILCLLLGQLWEPEEAGRMGGPGARQPQAGRRGTPQSSRRPAPAGYGSYGGYRPQPQGSVGTPSRPKAPSGYGSYGGYRPQKRQS